MYKSNFFIVYVNYSFNLLTIKIRHRCIEQSFGLCGRLHFLDSLVRYGHKTKFWSVLCNKSLRCFFTGSLKVGITFCCLECRFYSWSSSCLGQQGVNIEDKSHADNGRAGRSEPGFPTIPREPVSHPCPPTPDSLPWKQR